MSYWLTAGLLCLACIPTSVFGQSTPPYQDPIHRQVCISSPAYDAAGGTLNGDVEAGEVFALTDLDIDADGTLWLMSETERGPRAIRADRTAHFCDYGGREDARPMPFLAPPNTCHVIAASRQTLDEANAFAAEHADYQSVMNVFRARNGWYAISFGLVSVRAADDLLAHGRNIPEDAYCSDGSNYFDIMERQGDRFVELDPVAPADPVARHDEAMDLNLNRTDENSNARLRRSCHLGVGYSCALYASHLKQAEGLTDETIPEISRFNLLGCMLGEPGACNNLLFDKHGWHNKTLFTAFPDRISAASAPPTLDPELAKAGCDADLAPSCGELAKPGLQYWSEDLSTYLMSLEATYIACIEDQLWYCHQFGDLVDYRYTVMENSWSPEANLGFARIFAQLCHPDEDADSIECRRALQFHERFVDADEGDDHQTAELAQLTSDICKAGSMRGCAQVSRLTTLFDPAERSAAAAQVLAACAAGDEADGLCDRTDSVIGSDLPEARGPLRAEYERLAEACRTEDAPDHHNPCRDALGYYAGYISMDNLDEPLALLKENCREGGRIAGCDPLYRFYLGGEMSFDNDRRGVFPARPELAREAVSTGCVARLEGVANCGSLGLDYEREGDFAKAGHYYRIGCETGMTAGEGERFGQGRICYWAAKNARNNLQHYDEARRWFRYLCERDAEPFACKFLGLMYAQGEGGEVDPLTALDLYLIGCEMVEDINMGDGQSCYLFGESLLALRDRVIQDDSLPGYRLAAVDEIAADDLVRDNLGWVSRAFLRGCMDDRAEACQAHKELLSDWSAGKYPRDTQDCRIMNADGDMAPVQSCQSFSFFLPPPEGLGDRAGARVFIWPDGDRTVVFDDHGTPSLNGATGDWVLPEGGWECVQSSVTGRSFCYGA